MEKEALAMITIPLWFLILLMYITSPFIIRDGFRYNGINFKTRSRIHEKEITDWELVSVIIGWALSPFVVIGYLIAVTWVNYICPFIREFLK